MLFGCSVADSANKEPFIGTQSHGSVGYSRALAGGFFPSSVGCLRLGESRGSRHPLRVVLYVSGLGSSSGFPNLALSCLLLHFLWEFQLELNIGDRNYHLSHFFE